MVSEWDWESGTGLLGIDDPAEWDAAWERGESRLGTAVVGRELTPELYAALRVEGPKGLAEDAINDALSFVPFRKLPPWFKWRWVHATVWNKVEGWWLRSADAVGEAWRAGRGRRSRH
ncbi:hypothetical protein [Streptomyces sp. NPDC007991]|uniref:hypothetical protein n=1 Tax=Streptomyces sp. NPDC007991 TaxID=3364803 RepID=UPI0036E85877